MQIRIVELADLEIISEIEQLTYPVPWTLKNFEEDYDNEYAYMFVLVYDGMIIGYGGFWLLFEVATITKLTIHPAVQNKKLGTILLNDLIKRIKIIQAELVTLEVRVSNARAIHLYEKCGFVQVGRREKYYSDGEDAYIMNLNLKEEVE